jgi:ABC-type uncharacterized transport system substrate-binding protein
MMGANMGRNRCGGNYRVANLAHPGGNITGFAVFEISLGTKWMEVLKQIAPDLKRVTTIYNPTTAPYYALYLRATTALPAPLQTP